ncbi:MAG: PilT/PilU family type 4a pilus ATPase, partial [Isosphaeraceae bacterium]
MATATEPSRAESSVREPEANKLFRMIMKFKGSDLHLKVGLPPAMRLSGVIRSMQMPPLTGEDMERLMFPLLNARQKQILEDTGGIDFAHIVIDDKNMEVRFRVNLFRQRGRLSLVARMVNQTIPNFEGLGLPPVLAEITQHDQGIIILAGVTGSGKSTTIASMLQYVNQTERNHIVTIEDPIEFTFVDDKCIINQREVGIDVCDWDTALKHAVRQDPDIILVGEMRDRDTFNAALHAAETGHLVFGTIHASGAPSTISRILDLFPQEMHSAMRTNL